MMAFFGGLLCGAGVVILARKLRSRPVSWANRRTVRILDLPDDVAAPASVAHSDSGDSITWGTITRTL